MSNIDDSEYIDWLKNLNHYEYSEFKNIQQIGKGSFGIIKCANWKNTDTILVLKSFINNEKSTLKEIVNEVCNNILYIY